MSTSLSSLVFNWSEKLHSDKCWDCKSELDYMSPEYNQLIFQCFECKTNCMKNFNKDLIKRFGNTYEFCNGDINRFILLLKKRSLSLWIHGELGKVNEISLPDKKNF